MGEKKAISSPDLIGACRKSEATRPDDQFALSSIKGNPRATGYNSPIRSYESTRRGNQYQNSQASGQ